MRPRRSTRSSTRWPRSSPGSGPRCRTSRFGPPARHRSAPLQEVATVPVPLDEYPLHQAPLSMAYPTTSDRNFYDRCYFNAHDRTGNLFLITGLGVYPNLGVIDAYATLRTGDEQVAVRMSDALGTDRLDQKVGPYRIEVVEPLEKIRIICDAAEQGLGFDLTWDGSFPAV